MRSRNTQIRGMMLVAALALAALLTGCAGSSSSNTAVTTTTGISVTVAPSITSVLLGKTQQFTATVTGTSNTSVSWKVNDTIGGNATIGTINTSGLYTAPNSVPNPSTVTITAIASADNTKGGSAAVTIVPPISVSPSTVTVPAAGTQQFSSTVNFNKTTTVTWQVNGVTGGDSTHGTISTSGLYTAPSKVPNPAVVTVTAVATVDSTQKANATVTIAPPVIAISPTNITLAGGTTQQFTATAASAPITPLWSVTCPAAVAAACGTIAADGTYTAPAVPPPGAVVTITASTADNSAATSTTTVTVQFGAASLSGTYAFEKGGQTGKPFVVAGVLTFDGKGKVTAGTLTRGGSAASVSETGTYSLNSDGRGAVYLSSGDAWQIVVVNPSQALIADIDGNNNAASGSLDLQQGTAGLTAGNYVMNVAGSSGAAATPFVLAADVTADGSGNLSRGILDANVGGATTSNASVTGSYTQSSSGTLAVQSSLGAQTFAVYQVDANRFKVVETDGAHVAGGELVRQAAGPFTNSSLSGRFAFTLTGSRSGTPAAVGGVFAMNGSGGIANRVLDGVIQLPFDNQGAYTVTDASTGRTTVSWTVTGSTLTYVMYPRFDGGFAIVETDAGTIGAGVVFPQTLSQPSIISLNGSFALGASGTELGSAGQEVLTGVLTLNSTSTIQGTIDLKNATTYTAGGSFQAGGFNVDITTGRGVASAVSSSQVLPGATIVFYLLDANHALVFESDSARVLTGVLTKQF